MPLDTSTLSFIPQLEEWISDPLMSLLYTLHKLQEVTTAATPAFIKQAGWSLDILDLVSWTMFLVFVILAAKQMGGAGRSLSQPTSMDDKILGRNSHEGPSSKNTMQ